MSENTNEQEIRVCKKCGYQRGFHVFFKDISEGKAMIGLICPSCGQSYDIGWMIPDINNSEPEDGKIYGEMEK